MTIKIECPARIKNLHIEFFDDDQPPQSSEEIEDFEPKLKSPKLQKPQKVEKKLKEEFLDFSSAGSVEVSQEVIEKPEINLGDRPTAVAAEMNALEL